MADVVARQRHHAAERLRQLEVENRELRTARGAPAADACRRGRLLEHVEARRRRFRQAERRGEGADLRVEPDGAGVP